MKIYGFAGGGAYGADKSSPRESQPKGLTPMQKPYVEPTNAETAVIAGFEGEEIKITIEQLEDRTVPQSTAGFLE
jgi:hypothetical protein